MRALKQTESSILSVGMCVKNTDAYLLEKIYTNLQ